MSRVWRSLSDEVVLRAFKTSGISNAFDSTEDDMLWEMASRKQSSSDESSNSSDEGSDGDETSASPKKCCCVHFFSHFSRPIFRLHGMLTTGLFFVMFHALHKKIAELRFLNLLTNFTPRLKSRWHSESNAYQVSYARY